MERTPMPSPREELPHRVFRRCPSIQIPVKESLRRRLRLSWDKHRSTKLVESTPAIRVGPNRFRQRSPKQKAAAQTNQLIRSSFSSLFSYWAALQRISLFWTNGQAGSLEVSGLEKTSDPPPESGSFPEFTLPKDQNPPLEGRQPNSILFIACSSSGEFLLPIRNVCLRTVFTGSASVTMPETSVNKNYLSLS